MLKKSLNYCKIIYLVFIAIIPISSKLRARLIGLLPNMNITKGSRVGAFTILLVDELNMGAYSIIKPFVIIWNCGILDLQSNSIIMSFVLIKDVDICKIGNNSQIKHFSKFSGPKNIVKFNPAILIIGDSVVINKLLIDLCDSVTIGNNVVFAGKDTQIWTHSFDLSRNRVQGSVLIKDNCYIGSRCIINLDVVITDNVVIHAGSVVNKSIEVSGVWGNDSIIRLGNVRNYTELPLEFLGDIDEKYCFYRKG